MTRNRRFSLNQDHHIIDSLSSADNPTPYNYFDGDPEDEMFLREKLLWVRLVKLVGGLFVDIPGRYTPRNSLSICVAVYQIIMASHLNTLDVELSLQHRFGGELNRKKVGMRDSTSLSSFVDDVECLLRNLYGESDNEAIDRVRHSVQTIISELTKYACEDLWREYTDAETMDWGLSGIGLPDGYGISGSEFRRGMRAASDLALRARAVRANPTGYNRYTVSFVDELYKEGWRPLTRIPGSEDVPEDDAPF